MSTLDELSRDILASTITTAGAPAIWRWANNRYQEMVARVKFRHLRKQGELSLPAVVDTGTITATRGSVTVTPDATAQAAWLTSPGVATHEFWYLRARSGWYKVASVDALAATITLTSAFAEDTVTAGSYKLVKRIHPLASTARWMGAFYLHRVRLELETVSLTELDILFPGRVVVGHYPTHVAQVGLSSSNILTVEIYSPPTETELISYVYWELPSALSSSTTIPAVIDSYTLKEGIMIDVFRFEKLTALRKGNAEVGAVFANEEAKQRKIWDEKIKDAIRTSRGSDDITLLLEMFHGRTKANREQRTAHDYVYDNWNRP